jgi:dihydrofolate synthase/folylpolyglutamate synthase
MEKIMNEIKQSTKKVAVGSAKQRSYNEVVSYFDSNWQTTSHETSLENLKQLDKALGSLASKVNAILVSGTNGKSLTIHYTTKILRKEGLSVGSFSAPHILTYNERFAHNQELIANKTFTDLANDVVGTAESLGLAINSYELLFMMALCHFKQANVDVALFEVTRGGYSDPTVLCNPRIAAITRITEDHAPEKSEKVKALVDDCMGSVKKGTNVVSANQSKIVLNDMEAVVESRGGLWTMPIRKLAPLAYPFEQLHGRCAALAERVADIYINDYAEKDAVVLSDSLLTKTKGRRGRPTLEAKRQSEINPKQTIEQFWTEDQGTLPGRFELLEKEKPMIVLDNAENIDAFENLLLGVRLLHYRRPLKGLALIVASNNESLDTNELLRALRYFFKKTSGHIFICPSHPLPGQPGTVSWNAEQISSDLKSMKVKAKACTDLKDAMNAATSLVDAFDGLIVITGSTSIISEYWLNRSIKKF